MKKMDVSQRELARAADWKSHRNMRRVLTTEVSTLNSEPALGIAHYLHLDMDAVFVTWTLREHRPTRIAHTGSRQATPPDPSASINESISMGSTLALPSGTRSLKGPCGFFATHTTADRVALAGNTATSASHADEACTEVLNAALLSLEQNPSVSFDDS